MKHILCYGDSNTYGLSPSRHRDGIRRHDVGILWPGALQLRLGRDYRVIEEGLNGRTTVFDDSISPGRNGLTALLPCIESHRPLDLIIFMLGTNDCKAIFNAAAMDIANGMAMLLKAALNPFLYEDEAIPKILLAAPVPLEEGAMSYSRGCVNAYSVQKSRELANYYEGLARTYGCEFIDLAPVASTAPDDYYHLSGEAHVSIAECMAKKVQVIMQPEG